MLYRYIIASICVHPSYTSNREALIDLTAERVYLAFHSTENKKKILKKFLRNEKLKKEQIEKMIFLILIAGDIVNGKLTSRNLGHSGQSERKRFCLMIYRL